MKPISDAAFNHYYAIKPKVINSADAKNKYHHYRYRNLPTLNACWRFFSSIQDKKDALIFYQDLIIVLKFGSSYIR